MKQSAPIPITNQTMELADCRGQWFFDEGCRCWCLEDILYTEKATTPKFQRKSAGIQIRAKNSQPKCAASDAL